MAIVSVDDMSVSAWEIHRVQKRDGRDEKFDADKITSALAKAGNVTGEFQIDEARMLTIRVLGLLQALCTDESPTVERVQDIVEEVLLNSPYKRTAKAYIIYRFCRWAGESIRQILKSNSAEQ